MFPEYLYHASSWKSFIPLPLTAIILSSVVYWFGLWRERSERPKATMRVFLAFAMLGIVTGYIGGNSREPAVGAILPAVLSLVAGIAIYLIGKEIQTRVLVSLSVFTLAITLVLGFIWGSVNRIRFESYVANQGIIDWSAPISKITSSAINVKDIDTSIAFYRGVLGFELSDNVIANTPPNIRRITLKPRNGDTQLVLISNVPPLNTTIHMEKGIPTGITLATNNIHRMFEDLKLRKVEIVSDPEPVGNGVLRGLIADPDSNIIQILERVSVN